MMSRLLLRRQLAVGEPGHVLRSAESSHCRSAGRLTSLDRGSVLAGGQGDTASGEVVAGRAVEPEQIAAARDVAAARGCPFGTTGPPPLAWTNAPSASISWGVNLTGFSAIWASWRPLASARWRPGSRPRPRRHLSGTARESLHALQVHPVAADAGVVVELLALAYQRRVLLGVRGLGLRSEDRV